MDNTIASAQEVLSEHARLTAEVRSLQREHRRILANLDSPPRALLSLPLLPSPPPSPPISLSPNRDEEAVKPQQPAYKVVRSDLPAVKRARVARYHNYVPEEETIRNDYSQRYVDTGEWPQNWVLGAEPENRFEEYPKQQRLLSLKKGSVNDFAHAPMHIHQSELMNLAPVKFDVILVDPPFSSSFSWDTLETLPVPSLAADPSFVFLWVGSGAGEGLERGRAVLAKWGYRRCEDVVWIKTNKTSNRGPGTDPPTTSLLTRAKQHCLMGIRGTVRRSTDSWFVHCNVDTDVIIWEGDPTDPTRKPPEMYTLIENFCLGLRRLEIFGRPYSLRRGWVTAGDFELTPQIAQESLARTWDRTIWDSEIPRDEIGRAVVPTSQEIEILRPKSPNRSGGNQTTSMQTSPPFSQTPGHMLPARPNMNTHNRASSGGFSGGVGLGIVRPQQQQVSGMAMNMNQSPGNMGMMPGAQTFMGSPPGGMLPPNTMMGAGITPSMQQPMQMVMPMVMPGMGMPMGMGMAPFQPGMTFNDLFEANGMGGGMGMMGGTPDIQMGQAQMGMGMGMPGMHVGSPQVGMGMMYNPAAGMMGGGMSMGDGMQGNMNPGWNGGWHGMQ
ncbi:hypothetical protein FRB99_003077 [Tulasnella sp. 403]|nr:hypothetical protein FRB99_003077 [Tulasnella sp. 403]